jgi:hypothetical protein
VEGTECGGGGDVEAVGVEEAAGSRVDGSGRTEE